MNWQEVAMKKEILQIKRKRLELESMIASLNMRENILLDALGID
jgi:hypothetical protein